jgi:HK97 family phage major capsid protein
VITSRELSEIAVKQYDDAIAILTKDNVGAEDLEQAKRMREEAEATKARASELFKLEQSRNQAAAQTITNEGEQKASAETGMTWNQFVRALAVATKSKGHIVDPRLIRAEEKDMSGNAGAAGGFTIPTNAMTQIMAIAAPMSIVRRLATVIQMDSLELPIPVLNQKNTTAGTSNFHGGIRTYWTEDNTAITKSDATFDRAILRAWTLAGSTNVPNQLLNDSTALASFLGSALGFPGAIAWEEDYNFLRGSGVGRPIGVVSAPATKGVARATSSQINYADLTKMEAGHLGNGVWVASIAAKEALLNMTGPSGNASYLWGSARDGVPDQLMGRPIYFSDKLPAVGTLGDIGLYDFSYYMIGDRQNATSVESDASEKFSNNHPLP